MRQVMLVHCTRLVQKFQSHLSKTEGMTVQRRQLKGASSESGVEVFVE